MMSVTSGNDKVLRPCRGGWRVINWKADLGRRYALPQATLRCPSGALSSTDTAGKRSTASPTKTTMNYGDVPQSVGCRERLVIPRGDCRN